MKRGCSLLKLSSFFQLLKTLPGLKNKKIFTSKNSYAIISNIPIGGIESYRNKILNCEEYVYVLE